MVYWKLDGIPKNMKARFEPPKQRRHGRRDALKPNHRECHLNPYLDRLQANRRWTRKELHGQQDVYESYAKSAAKPFRGKPVDTDGLQ